jgi:hypothetical protein
MRKLLVILNAMLHDDWQTPAAHVLDFSPFAFSGAVPELLLVGRERFRPLEVYKRIGRSLHSPLRQR